MKITIAAVTGIAAFLWVCGWLTSRSANPDMRDSAVMPYMMALGLTVLDVLLIAGFALYRLFAA